MQSYAGKAASLGRGSDYAPSLSLSFSLSLLNSSSRTGTELRTERCLQFANIETDKPVVAWCSACGRAFMAEPKSGDRTDDLILRVRAEFEAHNCKERSSRWVC